MPLKYTFLFVLTFCYVSLDSESRNEAAQAATVQDYQQVTRAQPTSLIATKLNTNQVHLDWLTASEKDNAYFDVERSSNANTF